MQTCPKQIGLMPQRAPTKDWQICREGNKSQICQILENVAKVMQNDKMEEQRRTHHFRNQEDRLKYISRPKLRFALFE